MRKLVSILSPVYWTTAKEIGEAMNGFTLTDAVFKRETQVEFATGEFPGVDQLFLCPVSQRDAAFLKRQQGTIAEIWGLCLHQYFQTDCGLLRLYSSF